MDKKQRRAARQAEIRRLVSLWQQFTSGYSKRKLTARAKAYIDFHGIQGA